MTRLDYSVKDNRYTLKASGHCGAAPLGTDIVCAAVSSHFYTLLEALRRGDCEIIAEGELDEDGAVTLSADIYDKRTQAVFDAICAGLVLLSENYPEYLEFSESFE